MKIEFYTKKDGIPVEHDWNLIIVEDIVYQRSEHTYESQSAVIGFWNFIEERPDLDWRAY